MPRNVRNFWITADIDGRKSRIAAGPVRKDGGFSLVISIRDKGDTSPASLEIDGIALPDGKLILRVTPFDSKDAEWTRNDDKAALRLETER